MPRSPRHERDRQYLSPRSCCARSRTPPQPRAMRRGASSSSTTCRTGARRSRRARAPLQARRLRVTARATPQLHAHAGAREGLQAKVEEGGRRQHPRRRGEQEAGVGEAVRRCACPLPVAHAPPPSWRGAMAAAPRPTVAQVTRRCAANTGPLARRRSAKLVRQQHREIERAREAEEFLHGNYPESWINSALRTATQQITTVARGNSKPAFKSWKDGTRPLYGPGKEERKYPGSH